MILTGCQINYLINSGYHQAKLLRARVPIEDALKDTSLSEATKGKLRLAQEARVFAQTRLGLKPTENYTSYVQLDRDYVTWAVSAAPRYELTHHLWTYPMVGRLPYKGFFNKEAADAEAAELSQQSFDTYVRGVTAYSTLGWFKDPLLSSMIRYEDHDLVEVIIHETVHATVYIKSEADFNERLATFVGGKGTEIFYKEREGENSPTLTKIKTENADTKIFSKFISEEIRDLKKWYEDKKGTVTEEQKATRLKELQQRFVKDIQPLLGPKSFASFSDTSLNNAKLLGYQTYFMDMSLFEKRYEQLGRDFGKLLEFCKTLEKSSDPEKALKEATAAL